MRLCTAGSQTRSHPCTNLPDIWGDKSRFTGRKKGTLSCYHSSTAGPWTRFERANAAVTVTGRHVSLSPSRRIRGKVEVLFLVVCCDGVQPQTSSPSRPLCEHHDVSRPFLSNLLSSLNGPQCCYDYNYDHNLRPNHASTPPPALRPFKSKRLPVAACRFSRLFARISFGTPRWNKGHLPTR